MRVELGWPECRQAAHAGVERRLRALYRNRQDRHGHKCKGKNDWDVNVEGAAAEMALAKALNRFWSDTPAPDYGGDLGDGIQARSTEYESGCLIVHKNDDDAHRFYLVIGKVPHFRIAGWLTGAEAKNPRFWKDPGTGRPAFFVPQSELHPLSPVAAAVAA